MKQQIEAKRSDSRKQVGLPVTIRNIPECLKAGSEHDFVFVCLFESSVLAELVLKAEHSFKDMLTVSSNSFQYRVSAIHPMPLCIQWTAEFI